MNSSKLSISTRLKVRFHECDPLQIVWHGNYFKYFEVGREDFCARHGFSYLEVKEKGYATPIVKTICEHKLPLRYGDEFIVETKFVNSDAAKLIFKFKIYCNEKLICTGETTQVFLDENAEMVLYSPAFFLDWKKKMGLI